MGLKTDVLCIDFGRAGIAQHCLPICRQLHSLAPNLRVKALHRESLYADRSREVPQEDIIEGLECYDISYFPHRRNLKRVLKEFDPTIVLMLTHSFLFDRAIIRLCRKLGIRSVYLQHGAVNLSLRKPLPKARWLLPIYLRKVARYALFYLPVYVLATWPEDPFSIFRPQFLRFLLGSIFSNYSLVPPEPTSEVRADRAWVYGAFYAEKVQSLHGYQDSDVCIVGNPTFDPMVPLMQGKTQSRENWLRERRLDPTRGTLTYLPQPVVEEGYVDRADFDRFMTALATQTAECGFNLLVKLHPRSDPSLFSALNTRPGVAVGSLHLSECIFHSDVVLGHFSTALGLAVAVHKPVLIWDLSKGLARAFGNLEGLRSIARVIASADELAVTLRGIRDGEWQCDVQMYDRWLDEFACFAPDEPAAKRIARLLIREYKACESPLRRNAS